MRISDWSSDVCSSDLARRIGADQRKEQFRVGETAGLVTLDRGSRQIVGPDEVVVPIAGANGETRVTSARREQGSIGADPVCPAFVEIGRATCRDRVWQSV